MPTIGLNNQFTHEFVMLSKMQHQVVGTGYECFKSRVTKSFTITALSDKIEGAMSEEWITLSYLECWEMVERQSCKVDNLVYNLSCHDESCWYSGKIEEKYSWWSTNWVSTYRCGFRKRHIDAVSLNNNIFNSHCKPLHMRCVLPKSTVVWRPNILHTCPFEVIGRPVM